MHALPAVPAWQMLELKDPIESLPRDASFRWCSMGIRDDVGEPIPWGIRVASTRQIWAGQHEDDTWCGHCNSDHAILHLEPRMNDIHVHACA